MAVEELRVHGVSGTPPRDILYTDPVRYGRKSVATHRYRPPSRDPCFDTSAFDWANLTSGSRITALWILLAPYALANVAGWMAGWNRNPTSEEGPGDHQSWHRRLGRMAIRCAGLGLTSLFVAQALTSGVLLPMRWLTREDAIEFGPLMLDVHIDDRIPATALVTGVALLFYWLVAIVSTRTHFRRVAETGRFALLFDLSGEEMSRTHHEIMPAQLEPREDPGGALVTDTRLWVVHPMLHRLRRLHLATGFLVMAAGIGAWTGSISIHASLIGLLVVLALFGWMTTYAPGSELSWRAGALAPHLSVLVLGSSLVSIWTTDPGNWSFESFHVLTFGIAAILAVFAFGSLAAGPLSLGAITLATFVGVVLGTTVGLSIDGALSTDELLGRGAGWVAVAMLALIGWLIVVSMGLALLGRKTPVGGATAPLPAEWGKRRLVLLRRVVLEARVLFYASGLFGIVAAIYVFAAIWIHGRARGASGLLETLRSGLDPAALGTFPQWLVSAAVTITIVTPGYFAIRSIRKGWISEEGGRSRRRQVGILWDLASFWPRWYHPLAPPGYGPSAIRDLGEILDHLSEGAVVGAHSQGSLISAVTIQQRKTRVGLITYGSQLGILYPRMFPATGIPELVDDVASIVPSWVNLWRDTDPIGGQYVAHPDIDNRLVAEGIGHSRYEPTPSYSMSRREVAGLGEGPCRQ